MKKRGKLGILICLVALGGLLGPSLADAASTTRYFQFVPGGSLAGQLWIWTTTGRDAFGSLVTTGTMPEDMADPAKLSWYTAAGALSFEYRNYRPVEYANLTNWRNAQEPDPPTSGNATEIFAFNLAGVATGTSYILEQWGEDAGTNVTAISNPLTAPAYDNVGTGEFVWFGQTALTSEWPGQYIPTWWCEDVSAGFAKNEPGPTAEFEYTLDDSAIDPEGEVTFWVGGVLSKSLAGLVNHNEAYGVLEGNMQLFAHEDKDGDGYYATLPNESNPEDCDDDPTDDVGCVEPCSCGEPACVACAKCIYKGAAGEVAGDGIDTNCNGQDDCFIATAAFGTPMEGKIDALRHFRDSVLMKHHWGRVLVDTYYYLSPPVASYIDDHSGVKAAVRTLLLPVVGATWMVNAHKGAAMAMALGFCVFGLVLRRKEKMRSLLVLLLALGFAAMPVLASAGADSAATFDEAIKEGKTCSDAVEALIADGIPEAEVVEIALQRPDSCNETEIITSAIRAGGDPFTVAYVAKNAGVDLDEVVTATDSGSTVPDFSMSEPPPPAVPIVVTGTGSAWGSSQFIASPSL